MAKFRGKRLAALFAAGIITLSATGCSRAITGYKSYDSSTDKTTEQAVKREGSRHGEETNIQIVEGTSDSDLRLEKFRQTLMRNFKKHNVTLERDADEFVTSIYIDGRNVRIVLKDGSEVSGELEHLCMSDLHLENLYVYDSQYSKAILKQYGYMAVSPDGKVEKKYATHRKLTIEFPEQSRVFVHNELKIANGGGDCKIPSFLNGNIDISDCKDAWFSGEILDERYLKIINSAESLKRLFLTGGSTIYTGTGECIINSPTLEVFILEPNYVDGYANMYNFNLKGCPNLTKISLGNNTEMEDCNGLTGLKNLQVVSFGNFPSFKELDIVYKSFEQKEEELLKTYPTDSYRIGWEKNNFIHDISGIMGSNIEVLNISHLCSISSEHLYNVVISLPNLREIVGQEINNAAMCSEQLIQYCNEHNIKTPFTERSLAIKNKLKEIVANVTTPDMNDFQKVDVLSTYIMDCMVYDYDIADALETNRLTFEQYEKGWGKNLEYALYYGKGVCSGYKEIALALFTEAGVRCYNQYTGNYDFHTFILVEIDGTYYQIDLTKLDVFPDKSSHEIKEYPDEIKSKYYMVPVGEKGTVFSYFEPYGAELQKKQIEQKRKLKEHGTTTLTESRADIDCRVSVDQNSYLDKTMVNIEEATSGVGISEMNEEAAAVRRAIEEKLKKKNREETRD